DAWLRCADRHLAEGKAAEAAAIYNAFKAEEPRPVRMAALRGALRAAGDNAGLLLLLMLASDDTDARAVATGTIAELGPGALKGVAAGLNRLPPAAQVAVLGALAARGERAYAATVLAATKSQDENVRRAALLALG